MKLEKTKDVHIFCGSDSRCVLLKKSMEADIPTLKTAMCHQLVAIMKAAARPNKTVCARGEGRGGGGIGLFTKRNPWGEFQPNFMPTHVMR